MSTVKTSKLQDYGTIQMTTVTTPHNNIILNNEQTSLPPAFHTEIHNLIISARQPVGGSPPNMSRENHNLATEQKL